MLLKSQFCGISIHYLLQTLVPYESFMFPGTYFWSSTKLKLGQDPYLIKTLRTKSHLKANLRKLKGTALVRLMAGFMKAFITGSFSGLSKMDVILSRKV